MLATIPTSAPTARVKREGWAPERPRVDTRAVVDQAMIAAQDACDIQEIVGLAIAMIPRQQYHSIIKELLGEVVRQRIREIRRSRGVADSDEDSGNADVGILTSEKWLEVRRAARDPKAWPVECRKGGYKYLSQCGQTDLEYIIGRYTTRAKSNAVWAQRYCALRDALVESGADAVDDMPDEVVARIMVGA